MFYERNHKPSKKTKSNCNLERALRLLKSSFKVTLLNRADDTAQLIYSMFIGLFRNLNCRLTIPQFYRFDFS